MTADRCRLCGETHTVKTKIIKKALNDGYIPVISPVARDENGQLYNTNADAAAGRVAAALRARVWSIYVMCRA
jgi:Acetylglutamate kinase